MKKSKVFVLTLMFALISTVFSFANPLPNPNEIRKEIESIISTINLDELQDESERVKIEFMVNAKNEIVVLNVSDSTLEYTLKSKLNYRKVKTDKVIRNKIYTVPVLFKKK